MTLDISRHRTILFQILKDFFADTTISPYLGFKGGTAAFMFYGLDRFSVDLDFDLIDQNQADVVFERISKIAQKYGALREARKKRFNLFWVLSYEDKSQNIKIEINQRQFGSRFEAKTFLGIAMQVMVLEDMVAHKLIAMTERVGHTSRDIYDVWFFMRERCPINKAIVESRSGLPFDQFIKKAVQQLENVSQRHILDGLGELLTPGQKDWARVKLREETIALLKLRID